MIDGWPEIVIVPPLDGPCVHPATYLECQATRRRRVCKRVLKCERGGQSIQWIIERGVEPVSGEFDDGTVVLLDRRPAERVMTLQRCSHLVGCPIPQAGASHNVREQKGNDPSPEIFGHCSRSARNVHSQSLDFISDAVPQNCRRAAHGTFARRYDEFLRTQSILAPGLSRDSWIAELGDAKQSRWLFSTCVMNWARTLDAPPTGESGLPIHPLTGFAIAQSEAIVAR